MITLPVQETMPFAQDADGVVRLAGTRVSLDTVVAAFERGATAEEIAQQFPALALGDVYAAISFYLRRRGQVQAYLAERAVQDDRVRGLNEQRHPPNGIRQRLLSRRGP